MAPSTSLQWYFEIQWGSIKRDNNILKLNSKENGKQLNLGSIFLGIKIKHDKKNNKIQLRIFLFYQNGYAVGRKKVPVTVEIIFLGRVNKK